MSIPPSPRQAEWQPARVPRLAYRKPIPQDEVENLQYPQRDATSKQFKVQRTGTSHSSVISSTMPAASVATTKKKNSLFGGLFVKEPTLMALAQVEAELKAKHGAATSQKVPHVSSRKMPDHVPKVNSKWDGIPEAVKAREREEKRRRHISQRDSLRPSLSARSQSFEGSNRGDTHGQRRSSDAGISDEAWQSLEGTNSLAGTANSVWSGESPGSSIRGPPSTRSRSFRSPSGTSLPEITSFFPHHDQPSPARVAQRWQSVNSTSTQAMQSISDQIRSGMSSNREFGSSADAIPDHSSSPLNTPGELSPVTPSYESGLQVVYDTEKQVTHDTEKQVAGVKNSSKSHVRRQSTRIEPVAIDAFLAGEARLLELDNDDDNRAARSGLPLWRFQQPLVDRVEVDLAQRPDTSRQRLGIGANMVVRMEAAPWETQDPSIVQGGLSSRTNENVPRSRFPKKLALFK